jgi:pimeloyl-ACP methyl ester carboxylesterase
MLRAIEDNLGLNQRVGLGLKPIEEKEQIAARTDEEERVKKSPVIIILVVFLWIMVIGCRKQEESPSIISDTAISADGVPIKYEVRGKGEPALIFVHGWCCDRSYWNAQLPYFAQKYRVVAIDLAGHGESGLARKEWTMGAFGEDVVVVLKKLSLDRVILVGHSMGGPVILEAARRLPAPMIGLVLVDSLTDFEYRIPQPAIDERLARLRADFAGVVKKSVVETMFTINTDAALVEKIAADMSSAPPAVGIGAMRMMIDWVNNDLINAVREAKAPMTCINSDTNPTKAEINRRYVPGFKAKIMSGVGHFNMIEAPDLFNNLLEETVKEFERNAANGRSSAWS